MKSDLVKFTAEKTTPAKIFLQAGYDSLSLATRKAYESDLKGFYNITGKDIQSSTLADIVIYIKGLEKAGYKNKSFNRKLYSISKIFNLYKTAGLIQKNLITELSSIKRITKDSSKQVNSQIELIDIQAVNNSNSKTSIIIKTLANTGLRISELINIKYSEIEDYHEKGKVYKRIRIVGKGDKERFIFLSMELFTEIKKTFNSCSDYLFHTDTGKIFHRINLHKQVKALFKKLTGKDLHPHQLRHFFATYKINIEKQDIKAVSKYLGHSKAAITLDMYVDTALDAENSMIQV